jgi:hypothetical protein
MVIRLNDRIPTDAMRSTVLRPILPKLLGTRSDSRDVMVRRGYISADFACREAAPAGLEARAGYFERVGEPAKAATLREHAKALRELAPLVDKETARVAEKVARAAAAADAYAAAAAAAAAADAYAAAYAAAAYAAAAYAAAAYAYAAAADAAADARRPLYGAAARCIVRMCEVKP